MAVARIWPLNTDDGNVQKQEDVAPYLEGLFQPEWFQDPVGWVTQEKAKSVNFIDICICLTKYLCASQICFNQTTL